MLNSYISTLLWGWRRAYKGIITCGNAEGDFHTNMGSIFKK